jgi:hypothetical protein
MRELIWKTRFAIEMRRVAKLRWKLCWQSAGASYEMEPDCDPIDAVSEEISCWYD